MELFPPNYTQGCPLYKGQLQELVQKAGLPLPDYQHGNEGYDHAPKFRASVFVNKTKYTSELTFRDLKAAQQDAARLAYESLKNVQFKPALGPLLIHQEPIFCKSILHEYADKIGLSIPKYQTTSREGPRPVFISSLDFCGKTYAGEVAQSKKVAEQLVAKAAIQSLLVSDTGPLHRVIKSKENFYAPLYAKNSGNEGNTRIAVQQTGTIPQLQASIQIPQQQANTQVQQQEASIQVPRQKANIQVPQQQTSIQVPRHKANVQVPQQRASIRFPRQKASIESEVINYNTGHGAFPNTQRGIKRKLEFKPRVQNKSGSRGRGVRIQP